jgi:hypothetical protein
MSQGWHSEAAFEVILDARLLSKGFVPLCREGFDRERTIPLLKGSRAAPIAAAVTGQLTMAEFAA